MSGLGWVAAMLALVALVSAGAWSVCREGLRQGDEAGDAATTVALAAGPDGAVTVGVVVTNPGPFPIVTSAGSRWVRRRPLAGGGRTTRRRARAALAGWLVAVDAGDTRSVAWTATPPAGRRRLVVDIHVWQQPDRLRRHRHVLVAHRRAATALGQPVR